MMRRAVMTLDPRRVGLGQAAMLTGLLLAAFVLL